MHRNTLGKWKEDSSLLQKSSCWSYAAYSLQGFHLRVVSLVGCIFLDIRMFWWVCCFQAPAATIYRFSQLWQINKVPQGLPYSYWMLLMPLLQKGHQNQEKKMMLHHLFPLEILVYKCLLDVRTIKFDITLNFRVPWQWFPVALDLIYPLIRNLWLI